MQDSMQAESRIAAEIIRRLNPDQVSEVGRYLHDDIVMELPYALENSPAKLTGKESVLAALTFIKSSFSLFSMQISSTYCCGDLGTVIVEATSVGRVRGGSKVYQNRYVFLMTFEDRKVIAWREYFNPELVAALLATKAGINESAQVRDES